MNTSLFAAIGFSGVSATTALGQPGDVGTIDLVLNDPVFDGVTTPPWIVAAVVVGGLVVFVVVVLLFVWARGTKVVDKEQAFQLLSRRLNVGKEMREVLAGAARAYGCAPVALLVSERALREAVTAYQTTPEGRARPAQIERVQRHLLAL